MFFFYLFFFFFQAEDGIRDHCVTGVQTCALPISALSTVNLFHRATGRIERQLDDNEQAQRRSQREQDGSEVCSVELERRSEERRVGKECRSRWSTER